MSNKKHTMVLENRIIITTGEDSFRVVNTLGESVRYDAELPYNSVKTVLGDGDTLTIASVCQGKTRCLVNGLFSDYTLDGQEFNSLSELEEALEDALFKNPEGGGTDKTAAHFRIVDEIPAEPQAEEDLYDVLLVKREDGTYAEYKWVAEEAEFAELNPQKDWTYKVFYDGESHLVDKSYEEIKQAVLDGKTVILDDGRGHFNYVMEGAVSIFFQRVIGNVSEQIEVWMDGSGGYTSWSLQDDMDRVEEVTEEDKESTAKYPSVKAMVDYVANNKGMTEDEARTVSAALNDLNRRDISLDGRVTELEKTKLPVWEGTESDLPETETPGVLYLIHD